MDVKTEKRGGSRKGAGRKPVAAPVINVPSQQSADKVAMTLSAPSTSDPKEFLLAVMDDVEADARVRIDAAKALMPFMHLKLGEGGKKEQKQASAKDAGAGKFAPTAAPKLVHSR